MEAGVCERHRKASNSPNEMRLTSEPLIMVLFWSMKNTPNWFLYPAPSVMKVMLTDPDVLKTRFGDSVGDRYCARRSRCAWVKELRSADGDSGKRLSCMAR